MRIFETIGRVVERGPSRIRTGDGGFAIRNPDPASVDTSSQLGQHAEAEVPVVVPSSPERQIPPDLATVIAAWERLPDAIKAAVLALVRTAGGPNG